MQTIINPGNHFDKVGLASAGIGKRSVDAIDHKKRQFTRNFWGGSLF